MARGTQRQKRRHPATGKVAALFLSSADGPQNPRLFPALTLLLVLGIAAFSICHIRSYDLGWHIATGRWIVEHRSIPRTDPFSFSSAGTPWVSHEWLFGIVAYAADRKGGVPALVTGKAILIGLAFLLAALACRQRGATPGWIFLTLAASYAVSYLRLLERPDLFSYSLALGFLLVGQASKKRPWTWALLPFLQLFWVNFHGGISLLGWVLAGSLAAERIWETTRRGGSPAASWRSPALAWPVAGFAGVLVFSLANPHGWHALTYGLLRARSPMDNREFQSVLEIGREGFHLSLAVFLAYAGAMLLVFVLDRKRVSLHEWALLPMLLVLTLVFFRFRPLFVFLLAPSLSTRLGITVPPGTDLRAWVSAGAGILLLGSVFRTESLSYMYRFGPGIHSGLFPVAAVDFLEQNRIAGRMFNSYACGGYLLWRMYPREQVFIDGREDVFLSSGVLEKYLHAFDSPSSWARLNQEYEFDYAVVRHPDSPPATPAQSLDVLAFPRESWALLYFDDVVALYARRNASNASLISALEIRGIQPFQLSSYLDGILADAEQTRVLLDALRGNLARHPDSFRTRFLMGILAVKRGPDHVAEALQSLTETVRMNPDFAPGWVNLGSVYEFLGRYREAADAWGRALDLGDDSYAAQGLLRLKGRY